MPDFGDLTCGTDELSRYADDIAHTIANADESGNNANSAYTVTSFVVSTVNGQRVGEMAENGEGGWTFTADNTDSVKSTESVTPLQAAKNFGMNDTLAEQYLAAIAERDDYLAWLDTPERVRPDWTIHAVEIPADAQHAVDTKYGRTARVFGPGLAVYDEEPDAIVSLAPADNDRFRPTD